MTGPSVPSTANMVEDEDNDREMDSDDMRDFADQDLPDPSSPPPSTDHAGPIAQFLHALPDWMNCISDNVMKALEGLPVPAPGPAPPGISLQEAIQVHSKKLPISYPI